MKTAYIDCIAGASGDMLLGAILDAGLPEAELRRLLGLLPIREFSLDVRRVLKNGFAATKVDVTSHDSAPERHLADLVAIIEDSGFSPGVKTRAVRIFTRICEVEAAIHRASLDTVHLHEVGGTDALVDICGTLAGFEALGVGDVVVSPLPLGRGFTHGAHGRIPLPAPATVGLLAGCPVTGSPVDAELVTPTGAALLVELARSFGPLPSMTLGAVGYGAGTRELEIPNVLRLFLGESTAMASGVTTESLVQLETHIDNDTPETLGHVARRLMREGALDVAVHPIQMKKDRPAVCIVVLCQPQKAPQLEELLFRETATLGVRRQNVLRDALPRESATVSTPFGNIRCKLAVMPGGGSKISAEFDDCHAAALAHGIPMREVMRAALHAAEHHFGIPHHHGHESGHHHAPASHQEHSHHHPHVH